VNVDSGFRTVFLPAPIGDVTTNIAGTDYSDNFFFVGAEGELGSPKLQGTVRVGGQERDFDTTGDSDSSISYDASVTYFATPKMNYQLKVSKDFRTSGNGGSSYDYSSVTGIGQYQISQAVALYGVLTVASTDYDPLDRAEDILSGRIGARVTPNEFLSLTAELSHRDVDGDTNLSSDFKETKVFLSASLRY